jgi:AcrR family transcriptional regulator
MSIDASLLRQQPPPGLRERKKLRTRRILQTEALRLFEARGYEATTIEDIAAAAEMSPRTFSRHFRAKEDVVLWDDFAPTFFELFARRPADEPLAVSIGEAIRDGLRSIGPEDRARMQRRMRLIYSTPALRERGYPQLGGMMDAFAGFVARRLSLPSDDLRPRIFAGALMGGLVALFELWQEQGGEVEEDALDILFGSLDFALLAGSPKPGSQQ